MRLSIRNALIAILLPLVMATTILSLGRISDLVTVRSDVESLRESALRWIYAERYARYQQVMLKEVFDHISGRRSGLAEVNAARAGVADTLNRMRPLIDASASGGVLQAQLSSRTLEEWARAQEQVDRHIDRAIALRADGGAAAAERLLMEDLETLVRGRILSSIERKVQREQELLEIYRVRVARGIENTIDLPWGAPAVGERLLPQVYEAVLAERFLRDVYADFNAFSHSLAGGHPLPDSHGVSAAKAVSQLSQLQSISIPNDPDGRVPATRQLESTYSMVRQAYARTLAVPPAKRDGSAKAGVARIDDMLNQSLLPQIKSTIWAREESVDRALTRLDERVVSQMILSASTVFLALLIAFASPFLAYRLLVRPVDDLLATLRKVMEGQAGARSHVASGNPLRLLASGLNSLLDHMQVSVERLDSLSLYDSKTGLPNREFFQERLSGALVRARLEGRELGLLSLSLDGMQQINDTLGRGAGDELMRAIAARLRECVRISDVVSRPSEDESPEQISHLGGDEFSILLSQVAKGEDASIAAGRVVERLSEPIVISGHSVLIRSSVGIGVFPQDGSDAETLLRNASAAMNEAKNSGGNEYQYFSESMNVANSRKLHIQGKLSTAIADEALELHFQPVRDAKSGRLMGAEALLRWVDSEMGPVAPDEFIPIAEQSGLISGIGRWVFETACHQMRTWQEMGFGDIRVSVNTSPSQFNDPDWVSSVESVLRDTGVSPGCIEIEITETSILGDASTTTAALNRIAAMGIGVVLDDFGTGYSSLSHLKDLPISRVKIDRSFVAEITDREAGTDLARAIVELAHGLSLGVVAEGVETQDQAIFLRNVGCDELQGFLLNSALKATEFERLLESDKDE